MYGRTVPPRLICPLMSVPQVVATTAALYALKTVNHGFEESVPVADQVSARLYMVYGSRGANQRERAEPSGGSLGQLTDRCNRVRPPSPALRRVIESMH